MLNRSSDDDRAALFDDEDAVVTETIAELYTRQGFFDRAAEIYRELIRRRGSDASLEAKLRRVEAMASGSAAESGEPSTSAEPETDVRPGSQTYGEEEPAVTGSRPGEIGQPDVAATSEDEIEGADTADSLYPLIGPAGDFPPTDDAPDEAGELESEIPPAYDFAAADAGQLVSDADHDDLQDLLIDPYADPFGSVSSVSTELSARSFGSSGETHDSADDFSGTAGTGSDPFADSFSEGFPLLDDHAQAAEGPDRPAGTDTEPGDSVHRPITPSAVAISDFLKSVATWTRPERGGEAEDASPGLDAGEANEPGSGAREEEETFLLPTPIFDEPQREEDSPKGWDLADIGFDAALGHTAPEIGPADAEPSEPVPTETSGADDLQLVSGTEDLFPWEIPVPEPGPDALPPVLPLDLDPGYPFEEDRSAVAGNVEENIHAERFPSEAVEPSAPTNGPEWSESAAPEPFEPSVALEPSEPSTAAEPEEGNVPPAAEMASEGIARPDQAETDEGGTAPSLPAEVQDDDDLESFQAWLRSLKR